MEYTAAEKSWSFRKTLSDLAILEFRLRFMASAMKKNPSAMPTAGEMMMNREVLIMPLHTSVPVPAFVTPAPIRPPIRAWEELLGSP